jgi:hypothetical protein
MSTCKLNTQFELIDQNATKRKATKDMSYVRRTIDIILKEMNVASLSPSSHLTPHISVRQAMVLTAGHDTELGEVCASP